jgi:hypothetical protein
MGSHMHLEGTDHSNNYLAMKTKLLLIVALLLSASVGAFATAIGPWPTDAHSAYLIPGLSFTVGDKTFWDFGYKHAGTLGLTANEIGETPTSSGGEFGLDRFAARNTFNGFTSDSLISYALTAGAGLSISEAALTIAGFGAYGPAQVSVADTFSNGANLFVFFNPSCVALHNCAITDNTTFAGVLSLNVVKDTGVASAVSQTLEPASLALLGTSLLGLGYFIRKKKKLFTA